MTRMWSAIKATAPPSAGQQQPHQHQHQHRHQHQEKKDESEPRVVGSSSGTIRPSPPPTASGTPPSSRSSPRPHKSLDAQGPRSQPPSSTLQFQSQSPVTKHRSRLSRSSTGTAIREKGSKDREAEVEDENGPDHHTAALAGDANGAVSGADVARAAAPSPLAAHTPGFGSAIDPLSQHILMRKNTEPSIPQRLSQMAEGLARASTELSRNAAPATEAPKDKSRKGGSFLSRLGMRSGRKKDAGADLDSDSELGSETRMDGINARVFSQTLGGPLTGGGYVPHHKEPPRYIRTRSNNKRTREFSRMFLAQELVGTRPPEAEGNASTDGGNPPVVYVSAAGSSDRTTARTGGAIWTTEFSKDGKYLATAGRDRVVRIWAVLSTPEDRRAHEEEEAATGGAGERLSAPVFRDQPVKEFHGHTGEVLDLTWSKNNFLLSSSMDKTVRLWHVSRSECLCTFKHKDFVTRLAFHPRDDRFFLAGSLDTMLRLWSIPDQAVAFSAQLPDLVTAVAFSPDGKVAIAGLLNGLCLFFETEGLKLKSQIHVRSSRGKNAKGSKITGIQTMTIPPPSPVDAAGAQAPGSGSASAASTEVASRGEVRVLVTSNDSRIRIYSLRDKTLEVKLKGHENLSSQIAATFSDDGKYVICGSEDRKTFIWSLAGVDALVQDKDKTPCEYFEAHGDMVTTALFAPTKTRMLLGQSGDPIYDLCNPPPVVLQSLEEAASAAASQVALTHDSHNPAPAEPVVPKRPEPSPAYIARSTHYDGNIIVTTGDTGIIKVFRQDCAFAKRRHDSWETGSTFSRKLAAHGTGGYVGGGLGRSFSVMTRTSGGSTSHSRRGSLSQSVAPGSIGSPKLAAVGAHPDRILSWRQGIEHGGDRRSILTMSGGGTPAPSERSVSPTKASRTSLHSAYNMANEARKQPYAVAPSPARKRADSTVTSPAASVFSSPAEATPARLVKDRDGARERRSSKQVEPSVPPTPGFTLRSANEDDGQGQPPDAAGGGSSSFWNLGRWRGITGLRAASSSSQGLPSGGRTRSSSSSRLSLSKSPPRTEASADEAEGGAGAGQAGRRQSVAGVPAEAHNHPNGGRRKSIPAGTDSDARSIPANGGTG